MKKTRNIFISRKLEPSSPFFDLESLGFKVIHQSLLKFEYLDFQIEDDYDAVFFYSQKAIKHFFSKMQHDSQKQYGVMGTKSGSLFREITNNHADIIAPSTREQLEKEINKKWSDFEILCPMGINSIHSLASLNLKAKLNSLIIYNNEKSNNFNLVDCNTLLFTSPLNVESYIDKYNLDSKMLFAIGKTTADKLTKYTKEKVYYCEEPSENNLYKLVLQQLGTSE